MLACVRIRLLLYRLLRLLLPGLAGQDPGGGEHIVHRETVVSRLGDFVSRCGGTGAHKGGDAHSADLPLQLHSPMHFIVFRKCDTLRGG